MSAFTVPMAVSRVKCKRCKHVWLPKSPTPARCPECNSNYWNKPRVRRWAIDRAKAKKR